MYAFYLCIKNVMWNCAVFCWLKMGQERRKLQNPQENAQWRGWQKPLQTVISSLQSMKTWIQPRKVFINRQECSPCFVCLQANLWWKQKSQTTTRDILLGRVKPWEEPQAGPQEAFHKVALLLQEVTAPPLLLPLRPSPGTGFGSGRPWFDDLALCRPTPMCMC